MCISIKSKSFFSPHIYQNETVETMTVQILSAVLDFFVISFSVTII